MIKDMLKAKLDKTICADLFNSTVMLQQNVAYHQEERTHLKQGNLGVEQSEGCDHGLVWFGFLCLMAHQLF